MAEPVPVPIGGQPPNVLMEALARAAAELAAQDAGRRQGTPLDREDVEEIVEKALRAAFGRIHVDLTDSDSVKAFNATIAHAERSRGLYAKAGMTAFTAIVTAVVGAILAAMAKYVTFGGAK